MAIATALVILLLAAPAVYGVQHTVGGTDGWALSVNYVTWAAGKTFTVGDTLLFTYDASHAVDQVNQAGYTGCSSSNAIGTHSDGNTSITLSQAGPVYFICPTPGHCTSGMKLTVTVVAAGSPPTTSPTTPSPPATTPSPSTTTPSPPTTPASNNGSSPPPPPPSGAAALSMNMLGVPLALATLVAFMG
ncbi:uclacyanin-3 [Prunus yedoensis var. nudiflora]|uniref:Uclacyanin-3 n=1 Tax=Prunus yedoensis var. nudiflora TaxID=2094558 RepID=A0A314Y813_PRUYE|nr:uclacyanin-3 [Prunus yedoensis var. nudiflora]